MDLLEKDNTLLQSIFDASIEGILVVDDTGHILDANASCEVMFGYSKGSLTGKNLEILLPKKFEKKHKTHRKEYIKKPQHRAMGIGLDLWGLKRDGSEFPLDISLSPSAVNGKSVTVAFIKDATSRMMDMTALQETNAILQESNRKLGTLIGNLHGIVYRCRNDRDFTMDYISDGCLHITGYSSREFLTREINFPQITFKEDREQLWRATQKALKEKKPYSLAYRIKDKKGNVKYLREIGQGIFDTKNQVVALEGFISDITELKKTEAELRQNESKNKALLAAIPDMMFIHDFDGNFMECYMPGQEKEGKELLGKNIKDVLPKEISQPIINAHNQVIKTNKIQVREYTIPGQNDRQDYEARTVRLNSHSLMTIVRNISKKKRNDEELKESESKIRAILNAIPDLIFIHDTQGTTLDIQASDPALLRAPIETLIGKKVTEVLPKQTADAIVKSIKKAHRTKKIQSLDIVVPLENRLADFELRSVFLEGDMVLSVARDITESKAISKVLNIRNRALAAAGNGILIADAQLPDLPIVYVNDSFCQMTGYTKEEVLGINCRFLQNDDRDQKEIEAMRSALQKGHYCQVTLRNYRKDGTLFWNQLTITPVHDKKGLLTHFIGVQNDVTEMLQNRKRLEEYAETLEQKVNERTKEVRATVRRLEESNLSLEGQILETKSAENRLLASQGILSAIVENFPKGIVAMINKNYEFMYIEGQSLDELRLRNVFFEGMNANDITIVSEEHKAVFKERVAKTIAGEHLSFETEYNHHFFTVNTTPLFNENKEVTSALFVYNDITERKKIEQDIHKALLKEQELNELKSRFVSMASHEFRTPLSAILSSAILIGKQNEPGKEEKREKYIKQIKSNVRNLTVILNDFLSLSKLEEGKILVHPESFDLVQLTRSVVDEIETSRKEGQTFTMENDEAILLVFLDPKLTRHILINLFSNAIKYSKENTRIDVKVIRRNNEIILSVADQGMGIPIEEQEQLFERFFRARNATNIQGTGLGLHIVKQYTELMGGTVDFKSKVGKGTTFYVKLPLLEENKELHKLRK